MTNGYNAKKIDRIETVEHVPDQDGTLSLFVFGLAIALVLLLIVAISMAM